MAKDPKPDADISPTEAQNTGPAHATPAGRQERQDKQGAAAERAELGRNMIPAGGEDAVRDDL